jgi:hypothetical protein
MSLKKNRYVIRLVLVAVLFLLPFLPSVYSETLTNGQEPYFTKAFSAALLGSEKARNDDVRSFQKLIASLRKAEKNVSEWNIPMNRRVKIMLFADTDFPTRDVWRAAGVSPSAQQMDAFAEQNSLVFATMSGYEMAHALEKLRDDWFFLRPISFNKQLENLAKQIVGETLDKVLGLIKDKRSRLEANLDKTMQQAQSDYVMFDDAAYGFPIATIWVPVRKTGSLHRYLDTIVHEFGHHVFYQMVTTILNQNKSQKRWTRLQIFFALKPLLALNELFADYTAVSCGHNVIISVHNYRPDLPQDFKRYFTQERTLPEFVEKATNGTKIERMVMGEGHNSLNPSRSLLWKLKLAIGTDKTDRIFVEAARAQVRHYLAQELPKLKKVSNPAGYGVFNFQGYAIDPLSENLRFLKFLQAAADKHLNAKEKELFAGEAKKVFQQYYPLSTK